MTLYYNADGKLENFRNWEELNKCDVCGKEYKVSCEEQVPGFRDKSKEICPYCGNVNRTSMNIDFYTEKLDKMMTRQIDPNYKELYDALDNAIKSDNMDYVREQLDFIYDRIKYEVIGVE